MRTPNTECRVCGKEYYACANSKTLGGYKMVACSPECYQLYQIDVMLEREEVIPEEWKNIAQERITLKEQRDSKNKRLQKELTEKANIELGVEKDDIECEETQEKKNSNSIADKIKKIVNPKN